MTYKYLLFGTLVILYVKNNIFLHFYGENSSFGRKTMANKAKIPLKLAFTMGFAPGPISQGGRRWSEVVSNLKSHNQELSNDI